MCTSSNPTTSSLKIKLREQKEGIHDLFLRLDVVASGIKRLIKVVLLPTDLTYKGV